MKRQFLTEEDTSRLSGWVKIYKGFNSSLFLAKAGYFDERPMLRTSVTQVISLIVLPILLTVSWWGLLLIPALFFGWGSMYVFLPIRTGIQDCDSAAWGFHYHSNSIWFYVGGAGNFEGGRKWKIIRMPWDLTWYSTKKLVNLEDDVWEIETVNTRFKKGFPLEEGSLWKETHSFTDKTDGTEVKATISVREMTWRRRGLMWTKLFSKTRRCIDIDFDREVGAGKGSWKGGVLGCSYDLLPGETPYQCLKRMEAEIDFNC